MDPLLELFSFQGRVNRSWYFWHTLLDGVAITAMIIVLIVAMTVLGDPGLLVLPIAGVMVAGVAAEVAVTVKRLHDVERPSWHWWLLLVPVYNIYLALTLVFQRGTLGPNAYGPDPLPPPTYHQLP
ncbi:MAG TPA: DUF805 domain-containing protein [Longimicrobiales bacterium]|jgi:uncharacterized membrane protein YhaH (DUF805 family)